MDVRGLVVFLGACAAQQVIAKAPAPAPAPAAILGTSAELDVWTARNGDGWDLIASPSGCRAEACRVKLETGVPGFDHGGPFCAAVVRPSPAAGLLDVEVEVESCDSEIGGASTRHYLVRSSGRPELVCSYDGSESFRGEGQSASTRSIDVTGEPGGLRLLTRTANRYRTGEGGCQEVVSHLAIGATGVCARTDEPATRPDCLLP